MWANYAWMNGFGKLRRTTDKRPPCTWTGATTRPRPRDLLEILGYDAHIAVKGEPAPIQAGKRWPVERLHVARTLQSRRTRP